MSDETTLHTELVDGLLPLVIDDDRVRALWIEAPRLDVARRPYGVVTIHAVADEPDFPSLVDTWEERIGRVATLENAAWSDTTPNARQLDATLELEKRSLRGPVCFVLECSAFLAKRPRQVVVPLLDKTGHLTHVMDFSRSTGPEAP